jgi:hypothetical protein
METGMENFGRFKANENNETNDNDDDNDDSIDEDFFPQMQFKILQLFKTVFKDNELCQLYCGMKSFYILLFILPRFPLIKV